MPRITHKLICVRYKSVFAIGGTYMLRKKGWEREIITAQRDAIPFNIGTLKMFSVCLKSSHGESNDFKQNELLPMHLGWGIALF